MAGVSVNFCQFFITAESPNRIRSANSDSGARRTNFGQHTHLTDDVEAAHDELVQVSVLQQLRVSPHRELQAGPDTPLNLLVHQLKKFKS